MGMTAEEQIEHLTTQMKLALEEVKQTRDHWQTTQEELRQAKARLAELEKLKTPPPSFVKATAKKSKAEEKNPRKKREAHVTRARKRSAPTQIEEHRIVACPDCQMRLGGRSLARVRASIDVPPPPRVEVTDHRISQGWCSGCQRWHEAPADFSGQVVGQGRPGVRLASSIAYVRTVMRLPLRQIPAVRRDLHGLEVSLGEWVERLPRIKAFAHPVLDGLKTAIRASSAGQADETGWREDGQHGSIWSLSTPPIRDDDSHQSRGGEVVTSLIGEAFPGVRGSDCSAGYPIHQGLHHRSWVPFLRDIHERKDDFPDDQDRHQWAKQGKALDEQAVAWAEKGVGPLVSPHRQQRLRAAHHHTIEQQLWAMGRPSVRTAAPQHT